MKLGRLSRLADALGCARIATGHYARIEIDHSGEGRGVGLYRGADSGKDQSYFLYGVPTSILSRMLFPLGGMTKTQTRAEEKRLGVPNWAKKDSQELCFVPDGNIAAFIDRNERAEGGSKPGRIIDETGQPIAEHAGVHHFTVGQRKGLGLTTTTSDGRPRYVLKILPEAAEVLVGPNEGLMQVDLAAEGATWIDEAPRAPFHAEIQIRHRHAAAPARIEPTASGFRARFESPQRAIAPGQAAVIYIGPRVLGGGTIV